MTYDSIEQVPSLRTRKQQRQRVEIIENAIALFRESAFEAVPVRAIAARCDISEATFFNYFPNKDAVLTEWAEIAVDACFERAARAPGGGALRRQVRGVVREIASQLDDDHELMRQAWSRARVVRAATDRSGAPLRGRDPDAAGHGVRALVVRARERGEIRADIAPDELAELLRAGLCAAVARELTTGAGGSVERLETILARTADLLLDGFRKRNERVRASALRSSPSPS